MFAIGSAIAAIGSAVIGGTMAKSAASDAADAQREAQERNIEAQKEANKLDPRVQQLIYGDANAPEPRLRAGVTPIYSQPEPVVKTRTAYRPSTTTVDDFGNPALTPYEEQYTDVGQRRLINPASDFETPTQDTGIIGRIGGLLDVQQSPETQKFNQSVNAYLGGNAIADIGQIRGTALGLQAGDVPVNTMQAGTINAPSQSNVDLQKAYQDVIYGNPAENPYLTGALQGGIDQSRRAFNQMQEDAIRGITENVLPSIRSGAQVSGQYGGNRQALAESGAISELSRAMAKAAENYGNQNTAAVLGAKANAFEAGQGRALSAMSGLGGQQYSTGAQNAQIAQQTALANLESQNKALLQGYANKELGAKMQSGLLGSMYDLQNRAQNADINRLGSVVNLVQPFTKSPGISVQPYQPVYSNVAGGALGGASAGMGLYNAFKSPQIGANNTWQQFENDTANVGSYNTFNQPSSNVLPNAASAPSTLPNFMNNPYLNSTMGNTYGLLGSGFPNPKGDL